MKICKCEKCEKEFSYEINEARWINNSTYSEKIIQCPFCKTFNVLSYEDASGLNVNMDERYY